MNNRWQMRLTIEYLHSQALLALFSLFDEYIHYIKSVYCHPCVTSQPSDELFPGKYSTRGWIFVSDSLGFVFFLSNSNRAGKRWIIQVNVFFEHFAKVFQLNYAAEISATFVKFNLNEIRRKFNFKLQAKMRNRYKISLKISKIVVII